MIIIDLLENSLFAGIAAIGFGSISNIPLKSFPGCALLAAIAHTSRLVLMQLCGWNIIMASFVAAISIGLLERLFTAVLIFCYYDKILGMRKDSALFVNAFVLYYFFYMYFAEFDIMSMRLATLFTFCYWVLWGDLLRCFSIENNRKLFVAFVGIYAIFKVAGQTHLSCYSYDNCLFGAKSYPERLYLYVDETDN